MLRAHGAHIFGAIAIAVGLVIVWFYFYLRRAIAAMKKACRSHAGDEKLP
jgi:hypothetical protein